MRSASIDSGVARQRRSGCDAQRAEAAARRVDEHAVEAAAERLGRDLLGVGDLDAHARRVHPLRLGRQRLGAPRVALDGDDLAPVAHQRGEVRGLAAGRGAEVEDALAGLRVDGARDALARRATAA